MKERLPALILIGIALLLAAWGLYAEKTGSLERQLSAVPTAAVIAEILTPTDTAEPFPTPLAELPTETPAAAEAENCLDCHSDAETLKVLAVDDAPAESLSSGEG